MKNSSQLRSSRTFDLGYEQLLMLEDQSMRISVLFRGVWLGRFAVPRAGKPAAPRA
jgi:hypothetical protein